MNTTTSLLDRKLNSFAITCFRDTADFDYISARQSHRAHLVPQFLWSCQQALEKYLKCLLLLNRVPATNISHDLQKALNLVETRLPFSIKLNDEIRRFISRMDSTGRYRYMEASQDVRHLDLVTLDWAVWTIRRYCQSMNYDLRTFGGPIVNMLDLMRTEIERSESKPPHEFRLIGGALEDVISNRDHPARAALVWNNCCFGSRHRKKLRLSTYSAGINSPFFLHPELLAEAEKYVMVPRDVKHAYAEMARKEAGAHGATGVS